MPPDTVDIPPAITRLAAELRAMTAARRDILLGAECSDGFPAWWSVFHNRPGGWAGFKTACGQALTLYHRDGLDPACTLVAIELERAEHGF